MKHKDGYREQVRQGLLVTPEGFICVDELDRKLANAISSMATGDSRELKRSLFEGRIFARFATRECPPMHVDLEHGESTRSPEQARRLAAARRGPTPPAPPAVSPVAAPQAELPLDGPRLLFASSGVNYSLTLVEAKQLRNDLNAFFEG